MTSLLLCEVISLSYSCHSHFETNMAKICLNMITFDRSSKRLEDFCWSCESNFHYIQLMMLLSLLILGWLYRLSQRYLGDAVNNCKWSELVSHEALSTIQEGHLNKLSTLLTSTRWEWGVPQDKTFFARPLGVWLRIEDKTVCWTSPVNTITQAYCNFVTGPKPKTNIGWIKLQPWYMCTQRIL